MATELSFQYTNKATTPKDLKSVRDFLGDPLKSVEPFFPGLEGLTTVGDGVFRWQFKKLSYGSYEMQLSFDTHVSKEENQVLLKPGKDKGTRLEAQWNLLVTKEGTTMELRAKLTLEAPVPSFLKGMLQPVIDKEMGKLFDRYFQDVAKALNP